MSPGRQRAKQALRNKSIEYKTKSAKVNNSRTALKTIWKKKILKILQTRRKIHKLRMNKYDLKSLMELGQVEIARKANHEVDRSKLASTSDIINP